MQEFVLVISRCVSKKKKTTDQLFYYQFHFKGFYSGQKINCIYVVPQNDIHLSKGDDYLLWVKCQRVQQDILVANLIKFKKII